MEIQQTIRQAVSQLTTEHKEHASKALEDAWIKQGIEIIHRPGNGFDYYAQWQRRINNMTDESFGHVVSIYDKAVYLASVKVVLQTGRAVLVEKQTPQSE